MKTTKRILLLCALAVVALAQNAAQRDYSCTAASAIGTDAYACSLLVAPANYAAIQGKPVRFQSDVVNTGAATLNLNSLGAIAIKKVSGGVTTALEDNDIRASQYVTVIYDGTNFQMQSQLGNAPAGTSGVSSFTGDGTLISNSGSTSAVTATLATAAAHKFWGNNTGSTAAPGYQTIGTGDLPSNVLIRGIPFSIGSPGGTALTVASTTTDYITVPFACTIAGYNLIVDAGTITVKFWKVATGTAIPTSGNSISTSGVGIASGTAIHSTTTSDFTTTTVTANDIMAMNVTAVATAAYVQGVLQCNQ